MRTSARITVGPAIFVLMLTGAMASAQRLNRKSARPTVATAADSAANQKQAQSTGGMQSAQSNPMYKESKNQGTNPFYERDSAARKNGDSNSAQSAGASTPKNAQAPRTSAAVSHEVVEYKDPEDMTTRYRPGNNKTTRTVTPAGSASSSGIVEYKDGDNGTIHTRSGNPK